ncbi:MAG: sel1 repeat family protein [Gammaproteobacteria bacterium]|nr:sel1 repeat family protein [Gammaproteobacteria bacterium]
MRPRLAADVEAGLEAYGFGEYKEAFHRFMASAKQDDVEAQLRVGMMYRAGEGVPVDYAEAAKWYRRAAEQGHPKAQTNLAISYRLGRGVPQDHQQALDWYFRAARQGYLDAQIGLGRLYADGNGMPRDDARAYAWYTIALASNNSCECIGNYRDEIAKRMSSEELIHAKRFAKVWPEAFLSRTISTHSALAPVAR